MGIYYNAEGRQRSYRATLDRHGWRFERWFYTEEEARKALNYWERRLTMMFGPRSNKRQVEQDARREAKKIRAQERQDKMMAVSPCGLIRATDRPRRCTEHLRCPEYERCLDIAVKRDWVGWVSV